jgi:thioredoxin-related protein
MRRLITFFQLSILFLLLPVYVSGDSQVRLVEAKDLSADARLARSGEMPILLLVSQDHCPFCTQIKRDILRPMIISGEYEGRLLMREIFIDLGSRIVDFTGDERDSSQFTGSYGVYLTPTLLFLGPDGKELTERIVGIQTPEMFFYYVDKAIQTAITALRKKR